MFFYRKIISLDAVMLAGTEGSFSFYCLNSVDLASYTNLSWSTVESCELQLSSIQELIVEPLEKLEHGKQHRGMTSFGLLVTVALAEGITKQTGKSLVEDKMQNTSVNTQLRRVVFGGKKKKDIQTLETVIHKEGFSNKLMLFYVYPSDSYLSSNVSG